MKICCISDIHGYQPSIEFCDIIIIAGDLTDRGDYFEVRDFNNYVEDYLIHRAKDVVYVGGNHDFWYERQKIVPFKKESPDYLGTIHYLYNSSRKIQGLNFWGTPHTLRFYDWAFNSSEEELYDIFEGCPDNTDVIISHGPPRNILDSSATENGLGSVSLKLTCDRVQPKLCVFGHIHHSVGQVKIDNTLYVNAAYLINHTIPNNISPFYVEL